MRRLRTSAIGVPDTPDDHKLHKMTSPRMFAMEVILQTCRVEVAQSDSSKAAGAVTVCTGLG